MKTPRFLDMKLKTKIRLVLLFLFSIMTVLGVLAGYHLDRIADNSVEMMNTNLRTLNYTQEMWLALNQSITIAATQDLSGREARIQLRKSFSDFEMYMGLMANTLPDGWENDLMKRLQGDFEYFKAVILEFGSQGEAPPQMLLTSLNMQDLLNQIYTVNRDSILQTLGEARRQAMRITLAIILFGFFFFIFAVLAVIFFPDSIAQPIQQLTEGIREITRKNYNQRLEVRTQDEFGEVAASFNAMAEKLQDYERLNIAKILTEKRRIETIIGQMNEPIIGLDRKNIVLFINKKALELTGMKEYEVLKRPASDVAAENDIFREVVKEVLGGKMRENSTYPSFSLIHHGKTYYFEKDLLSVSPSEESLGEGSVIILKNITEFREQDLAKTNFMATLSHELKTPISAIDMSLGLLQDERIGHLNQDQQELAQTIRDNSSRLLKMVNEILDLSKIETGIMELSLDHCQAQDIIQRAVENTDIFVIEKGIRISTEVAPEMPALHLDVQKTIAVLTNFLTNAIRYSPQRGKISIQARQQRDEVLFTVTDEGPGIPEEDQQKIFQRYSRSRNDRTKGTGLGLAISKEFIEKQGGRVWVKSKVGEGSTFGFALPVG